MEFDPSFMHVGAITVICYLFAQAVKATRLDSRWLPVICGAVGGALGVAALYLMPSFPAKDLLSAAAAGIVSGLASTGAHECLHQLLPGGGAAKTP